MLRSKRKVAVSKSNLAENSDTNSDEELLKNEDSEYVPKKVPKVGKKERPTKPVKRLKPVDSEELKESQKKKRKICDDSAERSTVSTSTQQLSNHTIWKDSDLLAESFNVAENIMKNIVRLLEEDNTIPFMCRYRKDLIGNLSPDKLRDIKVSYNQLLTVKAKQESVLKILDKEKVLSTDLRQNILAARSLDELDHLYAPFKSNSKTSLAERAKSQGLQGPAEQMLSGQCVVNLNQSINPQNGLTDLNAVCEGIKHIISNIINRDTAVLEEVRKLVRIKEHCIWIHSTLVKPTKSSEKGSKKTSNNEFGPNASKFENYFHFHNTINEIKPHQILAINRGEDQKILKVTIELPDQLKRLLYDFLYKKYLWNKGIAYPEREELLTSTFNETISKKLQPLINRQIRRELTKLAEKASIDVFATNLKQLLLMSPIKGQRILGIDPGFTNGCKIALISECTDVICTDVIYPHTKSSQKCKYGQIIANMLSKHGCTLIALGNGTACRETEKWLSDLFNEGILDSNRIRYSIVSEQGASIYSCSEVAKKEFPDMDVNLISAVSIARRLLDPLNEFVKVEPKHLGVGMYQHDIGERYLNESLNEVVMECVSFVGVDINTASVTLLRHIAGLTSVRAENICKYRSENGPFKSREELKKVKQIGIKTFVQCAGFIRIEPISAQLEELEYNLLDSTWVHPESYDVAEKIMKKCRLSRKNIGSSTFITKIKDFKSTACVEELAKEFNRPEERVQSVLDALERELLRDYRDDFIKKPLFKQGLTKISDLQVDTIVTGGITNVTHFGCFVDIGVEKDALIHSSKLDGMNPNIGDRIEAVVLSVDISRGRISLKLKAIF